MTIREFTEAFWAGLVTGPGPAGDHVVLAQGYDGRRAVIFRGCAPAFVPAQALLATPPGANVTPIGG